MADTVASGGFNFRPFDASVRLAEVILGPNCGESEDDVRDLVAGHDPGAVVFRARLAWKHFKVVPFESSVP